MITRLVKLSFHKENMELFENIFYSSKPLIDNFSGCQSTNLFCDINHPGQYFTISYWNTEEDLENYRRSELFITTWAKVKPLFNQKAEAWSLQGHIKFLNPDV
ncbi:antibiotic biosynthesis monooxygenase family protein [Daejeonella oryzae]|uniref:antibiotic biosynthesis monooxygenase family protein n=1 Tax=Daejeonella oryzae TaxID=1122943 RepID=UPI000478C650|nr:antibiotic biosynthesis monooxygenase family protein [Daejeonella oryzae]